jgi:hypothetical protein
MIRTGGALRVLAVSVTVAALASACGGGGIKKLTVQQPPSSTAGATPTATPMPVVRTVGKTGWYRGFAVTVDTATLTAQQFGGGEDLSLAVTYQNLGTEVAQPDGKCFLQVGDTAVTPQFDSPQIPGLGKAAGTVTASLSAPTGATPAAGAPDLDAVLDTVVLTYGQAADNQTMIPLSASGEVKSFEPKTQAVKTRVTQGQVLLDISSVTLAPSYVAGEKDKFVVGERVKISCVATCIGSGHSVDRTDFSVLAPDGTSVVADARSPYCCDAIYPGTVSDTDKNIVDFVVAAPGTGKYTLSFKNEKSKTPGTFVVTF